VDKCLTAERETSVAAKSVSSVDGSSDGSDAGGERSDGLSEGSSLAAERTAGLAAFLVHEFGVSGTFSEGGPLLASGVTVFFLFFGVTLLGAVVVFALGSDERALVIIKLAVFAARAWAHGVHELGVFLAFSFLGPFSALVSGVVGIVSAPLFLLLGGAFAFLDRRSSGKGNRVNSSADRAARGRALSLHPRGVLGTFTGLGPSVTVGSNIAAQSAVGRAVLFFSLLIFVFLAVSFVDAASVGTVGEFDSFFAFFLGHTVFNTVGEVALSAGSFRVLAFFFPVGGCGSGTHDDEENKKLVHV